MVKLFFSNIGKHAAAFLKQILFKVGATPGKIDPGQGTLNHGRINPEVCFHLHSRQEGLQHEMPGAIRTLHRECRENFCRGRLFVPLGKLPGVVIQSEIIETACEDSDENVHMLAVFPCDIDCNRP